MALSADIVQMIIAALDIRNAAMHMVHTGAKFLLNTVDPAAVTIVKDLSEPHPALSTQNATTAKNVVLDMVVTSTHANTFTEEQLLTPQLHCLLAATWV